MIRGSRIELWVEERGGEPAVNPVMHALLGSLEADGARISVHVPEREVHGPEDPTAGPDLILLKSATDLALSRAVAAEAAGTYFLNDARATRRAHDKAAAAVAALAAAGLPVPETFLFQTGAEVYPIPKGRGGWVVKPVRMVHGRGVEFHESRSGAFAAPSGVEADGSFVADDGTRLLQRRVGGDEPDLKVYVADGRCFAGRKRFDADSYARDEIEHVELDGGTEEVVLGAGAALGLDLFGVDLRFEGESPVVIDANPFPGYRGFPEAVEALRAEIGPALEAACR